MKIIKVELGRFFCGQLRDYLKSFIMRFNTILLWIILLLILTLQPAEAAISEKTSKYLKHTTTALIVADWGTTLDIRRTPGQREKNNWAGSGEFKRSDINKHFLMKLGLHWFINDNLYTQSWKNYWNIWQIGLTYDAVSGNIEAGLSVKF